MAQRGNHPAKTLPQKGRMSRRELLSLLWWGAAGVLVAEGAGATLLSLWPQIKAGAFGSKIEVGKVSDFPVASVTYIGDGRLYLSHVRTADGASGFLALYRKCPHLGCVVPWRAGENSEDNLNQTGRFNCPCHSSIFDRYGRVKGGPAPRPMDLMAVSIEGDKVMVDTGKISQRAGYDDSQVATI